MPPLQGNAGEIHELARYEVKPETLERCLAPVEFIEYNQVDANALFRRV